MIIGLVVNASATAPELTNTDMTNGIVSLERRRGRSRAYGHL
jgi:hypothetical protein